MGALVWVGFAAFFVVSLVVGVRLLLLAARTRELPELLMGVGVLGIGPVGFGFLVAAQQVKQSQPELFPTLMGIGLFAVSIGALAKYIFNWRVYHPESAAIRALVILAGVYLVGTFLYSGIANGFVETSNLTPRALSRSALQVGCLLWGSVESLVYWLKMRRRASLGLADPVVTNRFLLWAIGAGAAGLGSAIGTIAQVVTGSTSMQPGWIMSSSSLHGLLAAIAIGLAFVPPAAYLRYIRSHGAQEAGPS